MEIKELINTIADCAKKVRSVLTPGFEEKVYKNAMFIELRDCGISVETEVPFKVYYKDHVVGDYIGADRIEIRHRNRLYKQKS